MTRPTDFPTDLETAARRALALEAFDQARRSLDAIARDSLTGALAPPDALERALVVLRDLSDVLPEGDAASDSIARILPWMGGLPWGRVAAATSILATGTQSWAWAPMIEPAIESLAEAAA